MYDNGCLSLSGLGLRHGNIYIMHQMMQHGADLRLVDLQGKTSLHHAVLGGSM